MNKKMWLWANFVNGNREYWAFDNPYPQYPNGDPTTLGEPLGYAVFKESKPGQFDGNDEEVMANSKRAWGAKP